MKNRLNKEYDILCVGSCVQDVLIEGWTADDFKEPVTVLKNVVFTSGGDATNEAVILSRLGSRTALLTKLDDGVCGRMLYEDLKEEGIDVSHIVRDKMSRTTTAFVIISPQGNHSFFLAKGENEGISIEDIDISILKNTRAVCIGSLYTTYRLNGGGALTLMKTAREAGAITFADMDHDVENLGPDAMNDIMLYVDYLLPSIEEAIYVTGASDEKEAAVILRDKGVKTVIIKLGSKGCFVKSKEEEFYVNPFDIDAKDTTGCGDNFVAGFIHSILLGKSVKDSALFACAAGAVNSQNTGGHRAVKSSRQLEDFIRKTGQRPVDRR